MLCIARLHMAVPGFFVYPTLAVTITPSVFNPLHCRAYPASQPSTAHQAKTLRVDAMLATDLYAMVTDTKEMSACMPVILVSKAPASTTMSVSLQALCAC